VLDSPEIDCNLERLLPQLEWDRLQAFYRDLKQAVELVDIRRERAVYNGPAISHRIALDGDPAGLVSVDLGTNSELLPVVGTAPFYGADYDRAFTNKNHTRDVNRYVVSRTFLEADLVISVPKAKTHKKAGITGAMKNLVGINGEKNLLPHYALGDALVGGDEYSTVPRNQLQALSRRLDRMYRDTILAARSEVGGRIYNAVQPRMARLLRPWAQELGQTKGDWSGNDVIWRTILDLNKILRYATADGQLSKTPLRRQLSIVDALIVGQGEGPHRADPASLGAIVAGLDAVRVDTVVAKLMGFDPALIPQLAEASRVLTMPLVGSADEPLIVDDGEDSAVLSVAELSPASRVLMPSPGWTARLGAAHQGAAAP
jgi:hypothetical protein